MPGYAAYLRLDGIRAPTVDAANPNAIGLLAFQFGSPTPSAAVGPGKAAFKELSFEKKSAPASFDPMRAFASGSTFRVGKLTILGKVRAEFLFEDVFVHAMRVSDTAEGPREQVSISWRRMATGQR